jgi:hypothetical protein
MARVEFNKDHPVAASVRDMMLMLEFLCIVAKAPAPGLA